MIKIIFDKARLTEAVLPTLSAVSEHNTVTAMAGILFDCAEGACVMSAFDGEKGIRRTIEAVVEAAGSFIVNAGKLSRIIRLLPGPNITLEINDRYLCKISSFSSSYEMPALPGSDFPHLPVLEGDNSFRISKSLFKKLINEVQFAIASNEQRMCLNGAFFEVRPEGIKLVTCDGNRLAVRECACAMSTFSTKSGEPLLRFDVPGRTLAELLRLIGDGDEEIVVATTFRHAIFFLEDMTVFSRLIDGEYIDYNRFIRKESKITVYASRQALLAGAERASLVTEERTLGQAKSCLKCSFEGQSLHIFADNLNGRVDDYIEIEKEGEDLFIGFNCRYLIEALRACPEDSLRLSLSTPLMSMQIEGTNSAGDDRFLYMVLPVKMS